jgi:nitroreductase
MSFLELAKDRFSVKQFTDRPVEKEKLDQILKAGNIAPTAANKQCQRIYVIQSEEGIKKINELSACIYGAKTVLMIGYDSAEEWKNPLQEGIHSGDQDASIVATHLMLEAWDLGVGSCWVNYFPNDAVAKAFGLPESEKVVLLLPLGYAPEGAEPLPTHFACKPIEDTVKYL